MGRMDTYMWVVAHSDDAEFSSAGTIARLTAKGKKVVIIQVTSGDKWVRQIRRAFLGDQLASGREVEERNAADVLGVAEVAHLRCTDGEPCPDSALREKIVRQIRRSRGVVTSS
ncbi:MAG: PIG-L family deacetylase [Thermomicrobiales bacterium]